MLKNYLKTAWRNILNNKVFAGINIAGLSVGLASTILIMLWVWSEYNVDAFHKNNSRLFHVYERNLDKGEAQARYKTRGLLASELKNRIPEIEYSSGMEISPSTILTAGDKNIKTDGIFAGGDFFKMFSYKLLEGTPGAVLNGKINIAISNSLAQGLFGTATNAIGKTIRVADKEDLTISGVFEKLPANSSVQFDFVRPWDAFLTLNAWANTWSSSNPLAFVQLRGNSDPAKVESRIKHFLKGYLSEPEASRTELGLQPYSEKYLHDTFVNGIPAGGRIEYVRIFSIVAIIILLIACINFMNLSTARAIRRSKEIGVRKAIGASRLGLVAQFFGEALLITSLAIVGSLLIAFLLLPSFNWLSGKQLIMPFQQPVFWFSLLGLLVFTSAVAGSYPAIFLSALKTTEVLKHKMKFSRQSVLFRKSLVVFQFTLSIVLIVGMIVISRQLKYIKEKNPGYKRDHLVYIPLEGNLTEKYDLFKEKAAEVAGVQSVSRMRQTPTGHHHYKGDISWPGKDPNNDASIADVIVGYDFVKTLQLELKEGRDFSRNYGTDSTNFIVNESMVAKMGFPDPLGRKLSWGNEEGVIVGVLKDFHFYSMHSAIDPMVIRLNEKQKFGTILVRVEESKTKEILASLGKVYKSINSQIPFTYQFADEQYAKLYNNEQLMNKLANVFAFIAIFISCMGLFGLATFSAELRRKEIGIRKVLGASVPGIISKMSVDFLKPVMIAFLIASPIAWQIMHSWLKEFAYKIDISWDIFGLAALMILSITLLTTIYQSTRTALKNPVKSLRIE